MLIAVEGKDYKPSRLRLKRATTELPNSKPFQVQQLRTRSGSATGASVIYGHPTSSWRLLETSDQSPTPFPVLVATYRCFLEGPRHSYKWPPALAGRRCHC